MTRFVVDAGAVLHLASTGLPVGEAHRLLARIGRMPIRLLGDAVLRRRAWDQARCHIGAPRVVFWW